MSRLFKSLFAPLRDNLRPYFIITTVGYGLIASGIIYSLATGKIVHSDPTLLDSPIYQMAMNHRFLDLSWLIFIHNLTMCLCDLVLPSLVIPFYAIFIVLKHTLNVGILYAHSATNVFALGVVLLEEQGYFFAALASYVYVTRTLFPKRFGLPNHWQGFVAGIKGFSSLILYIPAILCFSAGYESWAITKIVPENPFPNRYDPTFLAHVAGPYVTIEFNSQKISYDSAGLQKSDARIAQILPHDAGYFGPIMASRDGQRYIITISLPQPYWTNPEIKRRLERATKSIKADYPSREYCIVARSRDSLGVWKEMAITDK